MSKYTDLRNRVLGRPEDVAASKAADAALNANARREQKAGVHEETDEFLELNSAACEAAKKLPWWRRRLIDATKPTRRRPPWPASPEP